MAMLRTFGASTVVICRRCTSLVRPSGWRMTMSTASRSRQASMAAEPVSPEVAPTMVMRSPRLASTWSNSRPTSCSAMSLKARVGPWKSSSANSRASSCTSGATAGCLKPAYARAVIRRRVSSAMVPPVKGWITRAASSA